MIKLIISILFAFLVFLNTIPALALDNFTEKQIQQGEEIAKKALLATQKGNFIQAETYWSDLIHQFPTNPAVWSNRGNARVSQHKLNEAIADYNEAIKLAPMIADSYLNLGTALEGKGLYQEAIANYNKVLTIDPNDAMAYNNRGNAKAGLEKWEEALKDYQQATFLDRDFAIARSNEALTLHQLGKIDEALQQMKNIARKYPLFPDIRAALTAVLWQKGLKGEAESNWVATVGMDRRYQDLDWVKNNRRWPPSMITALDNFINLITN